ncbi:ABC-type transport system, involved in lipoprotein release, permease component [Clostridium pasteurianum DSM 525 = ATCC 6013]|uniref:ABC-type transport system, involved in lipoprotein release, permease component n=1 Tax=Clostridium pasteurianum DSM 525 = ATCC 6013 TaxID=1262449 RepID=A0A0H3J9G1_CLOPA|nr:FtsX-like permease family protein [Clostridium pasteurianum]AJA49977.1 ABC-type transport system, involved in lipoprotein release, permease component [Clostridium pasteurianum DSM 525 = ATCC 6013]AJA53965.1 ABC-type transport system, involved in lipoprotein release, permease component [Clostridium pasteurianum DSM 525 = ATCC 6013]AOZ77110.1 ABC transporter permease [Clostridium pasteurianum DSM 525 = ATCC 6013]AOZ80907.1 ABC transporter permease [Clostridium pasteurianum]ELP59311.1 ABC tran
MNIILKFVLRNIKEKKLRTFLVVISIMASTALFFAANGIASTLKEAQINIAKSAFGSAEIMITAGQESPSPYFLSNKAQIYKDKLDYIVEEMNVNGQYSYNIDEVIPVQLTGIDYNDLESMNPLKFIDSLSINLFQGNKIIISKKSSDKYNIKLGDKLKLNFSNNNQIFTVAGIVESDGIFKTEDKTILAIIPKSTAQQLNDARGMASTIYLKTKNPSDTDNLIKQLTDSYKNYNVKPTIDMDEINENTKSTSTAFMAMLIIVLTMSVFIIYTVFKVIIIERLPIIGTFRSIGATKFMTDSVLICESIIYGIIGGIIGIVVGIGIVKLAAIGLSSQAGGIDININYSTNQIAIAFIFAVSVSTFSAIIPIIKVSKLSVKDVVLNTIDTVQRKKIWKFILALVLILIALILPRLSIKGGIAILLDLIGMVIGTIGVVIIVPYFTRLFVIILEKLYALIFRNEGILAAKNLRNNKNILNNISLLTIGISALFMLNIVSFSLGKELVKAYEISKCDVFISSNGGVLNNDILSRVRNTDGISEAAGMYSANSTKIEDTNSNIMGIYGYNPKYFNDFMNVNFLQNRDNVLKNLYDNREIVITESVRQSLNLNIGDVITLKTANGDRDYKISGTFSTLMYNGSMAIVSEKYLKQDFKLNQYGSIFAATNKDPDEVADNLSKQFKGNQINAISWRSMEEQNAKQINQMLMIIKIFPVVSLVIGAFGVLNNFIISFMERKRQLAVLASVGMSKIQTIKMLFIEAFSVGIIGAVMGIFGGLISTYIMPFVLKSANFPMPVHYEAQIFITCLILGMIITLISSIIPALKSSKLNIIEAIKYE